MRTAETGAYILGAVYTARKKGPLNKKMSREHGVLAQNSASYKINSILQRSSSRQCTDGDSSPPCIVKCSIVEEKEEAGGRGRRSLKGESCTQELSHSSSSSSLFAAIHLNSNLQWTTLPLPNIYLLLKKKARMVRTVPLNSTTEE